MTNAKGTPKTLSEAIQNAITQYYDPRARPNSIEHSLDEMIEMHVVDFLAQKVSVLFIKASDEGMIGHVENFWSAVKKKAEERKDAA